MEKNKKGIFDRAKGIPREWFNEPWGELFFIIQKFLTCDRGYNVAHLYHIRLLQHIKGEVKINLPYSLFRNLSKMIEPVKNENRPKEAETYHQRLIKILVEYQIKTHGLVWREFLNQNQYEEQVIEEQNKVE